MKKQFRLWLTACSAFFVAGHSVFLSSCNDDLPAASYYTFTGEMMSDYLKSSEDFSLFARIVERAGQMDFLASRGGRTLFPPVNAGVEDFLKEYGYASVEDIPEAYCDTLVKACMIDNSIVYTYNLTETSQQKNELDLPLVIQTTGDTVDANGMVLSIVNRRAAIINELKNDSVENGVCHPVSKVLVPSTSLGASLLEENKADFTIYYEALRRTGLLDSLSEYRDDEYEAEKANFPEFLYNQKPGNYTYTLKRPDHRYSGFTLFIVPDRVLYEKYANLFSEGMSMEQKIDALYDLAVEKYNDNQSAEIFGLNKVDPTNPEGKTYKELYWNKNSLTDPHNPLKIFMTYHILDRMFASTDKFINCWGFNTAYASPTEWINTMLDFSSMKLEKVYSTTDPEVEYPREFYINHSEASKYNSNERVRGSRVTVPDADNFSLNVAYYYVDDVLAYDQTTRNNVYNTRLRIDFQTVWPELTNNDMRLNGDPREGYSEASDNSETGGKAGGFNYYAPKGYIEGVEFSETSVFMVHRPKLRWWDFGGDEITVQGSSYDVEFKLPHVPPGTYELRIAYPGGVGNRGIAQVYLDDVPQGLPIDMRYGGSDSRVAGLYNGGSGWRNKDENSNGIYTTEELEENARVMKNNGYYSAGKSVICYNAGNIPEQPQYVPMSANVLYNVASCLRRKICEVVILPNKEHTVRFRSVFTGSSDAAFVLEYMEMVPISICGAGGIGEDLY